jgi:large subunit ribosomal protein L4e
MFAPTKTWRKWHRKINTNQKRYAVASSLAASALPSLVLARGHSISSVPEIPLVLDNSVQSFQKTKQAVAALKAVGAYDDVEKSLESRKIRAGVGKMRNRRHVQRRGPLVVYAEDQGIVQAFRNLPGVELCNVERLNLLQLAPGGHLGRFVIWTQAAFEKLTQVWGSTKAHSSIKKDYVLPTNIMTNSDLTRLINSEEVQTKVRTAIKGVRYARIKKNPLKNEKAMIKLNPYALALRRSEILSQTSRKAKKDSVLAKARKASNKKHGKQQGVNYARITFDDLAGKNADTWEAELKAKEAEENAQTAE